ncbi:MAG: ATP-binding protein [Deltaproteobacteria bacterium]|nr:ATP-binding protein [Deltaproteobacteria bacterium]
MSLQTKLLTLSAAFILVPMGVLAWIGVSYLQEDKRAFVQLLGTESTPVIARAVGANLEALTSRMEAMGEVATAPYLNPRSRVTATETLFAGSGFFALRVKQAEERVADLRVDPASLGKSGEVILSGIDQAAPALPSGETVVENVSRLPQQPVARVRISRRASVGEIEVEALVDGRWIFSPSPASTLDTWVVDTNDRVLTALEASRVATQEDASSLPPVLALREGRTGSVAYDRGGTSRIGSYAAAPLGGLGVVQDLPSDSIAQAVASLGRKVALIALIAIVAALGLAFLVARGVSRPVILLAKTAEQIGQGELDAFVPQVGSGELKKLSVAFAQMQQGLAERDQRLIEAQEALVHSEKMGALGHLAAGITHEVKNPLSGILGYAQLAKKLAPEGSPVISHLETIEKESRRATEILGKILSFSRRETGQMEPLQPNTIVGESIKLVAHPLQMAHVQVSVGFGEGLPEVMGELSGLQQVLMNLCLNAADAMKPKGGRLELTTSKAPDGRVVISVKDEGHGITPENRQKLFTPFFTTKKKGEGTGLGLSVSYGIVQAHQGEIRVWSEEGVGTVFYVYLPPKERFVPPKPKPAQA